MKDESEAPDGEEIAALLRERYPLPAGEKVRVTVTEVPPSIAVDLENRRHRYHLRVTYLRSSGKASDRWLLIADALDALYGTLLENGRDYRALPAGEDIEHNGAFFKVVVEHTVPELEKVADQLLDKKQS